VNSSDGRNIRGDEYATVVSRLLISEPSCVMYSLGCVAFPILQRRNGGGISAVSKKLEFECPQEAVASSRDSWMTMEELAGRVQH
jgi:hypothetical protein